MSGRTSRPRLDRPSKLAFGCELSSHAFCCSRKCEGPAQVELDLRPFCRHNLLSLPTLMRWEESVDRVLPLEGLSRLGILHRTALSDLRGSHCAVSFFRLCAAEQLDLVQ
jgi:hypothetical protein